MPLYRLRIDAFTKNNDLEEVQQTVEDFEALSDPILEVGEYDRPFDIFQVSEKDIAELQRVFKEVSTPTEIPKLMIAEIRQNEALTPAEIPKKQASTTTEQWDISAYESSQPFELSVSRNRNFEAVACFFGNLGREELFSNYITIVKDESQCKEKKEYPTPRI